MAGSGTMRERASGVWTLRVETTPVDGKRKWVPRTFNGPEKGARRALNQLVIEVTAAELANEEAPTPAALPPRRVGGYAGPNRRIDRTPYSGVERRATGRTSSGQAAGLTVTQLFEKWLAAPTSGGLIRAESTQYQERRRYERHVEPVFGDREVDSLERGEIRAFYVELATIPRPDTKKVLKAASVARIHELLRAMCQWGFDEELVATFPLLGIRKPSVPATAPKAPMPAAVEQLLTSLRETDIAVWCAVRLAATAGGRRSELVALRWSDINWDLGTVTIEKGEVAVPGRGRVQTDTKTGEEGSAELYLDRELLLELQGWWMAGMEESGKVKRGHMFSQDPRGVKAWHPDTLTKRVTDAANASPTTRGITLKTLRAYVATELARNSADLVTAQRVLRHKSPLTTMRHYAAARDAVAHQATRDLGERLAAGAGSKEAKVTNWRNVEGSEDEDPEEGSKTDPAA